MTANYAKHLAHKYASQDLFGGAGTIPNKRLLLPAMQRVAQTQDVCLGLLGVQHWPGPHTLYVDHSYFARGWEKGNFRVVRGAVHLTRILKARQPRLSKFGVELAPYRKDGRNVIVLQSSEHLERALNCQGITDIMVAECRKRTDRPVVVKTGKTGLAEMLADAWLVVSPVSVGAVEALVAGVPVISTPMCPSWPLSNRWERIENPELFDREEWAESLAGASFNVTEMREVNWKEYQCSSA